MNRFIEPMHILKTLQRHWWVLVSATVLTGLIGYQVSALQTPIYQATATLIVGRTIEAAHLDRTDIQLSEQLALTYADIAKRQPVLQAVVDVLNLDQNWQELASQVSARPIEQTQLIEIRVEAESVVMTKQIANEIAFQLIQLSPTTTENSVAQEVQQFARQRLNSLRTNIENGQAHLDELRVEMSSAENRLSTTRLTALQDEVTALEALLTEWDGIYSRLLPQLVQENAVNNLSVMEPARASVAPIHPKIEFNTLLAALIGLFLAISLILVVDYFDDTFKQPADLKSKFDITPLSIISKLTHRESKDGLLSAHTVFSAASESYRLLRSKLQFMIQDTKKAVFLVTGADAGESRSVAVANLGIVLAEAGHKVVIVDAAVRDPKQHNLFNLSNHIGLTELLHSSVLKVDEHLQPTKINNLKLLTSGASPSYPSEMLGSAALSNLLLELQKMADIVLCDSHSCVDVADALALAKRVDTTLFYIESGLTRQGDAHQALLNLQHSGADDLHVLFDIGQQKQGFFKNPLRIWAKNKVASVANEQQATYQPQVIYASGSKATSQN